MAGATPVADHVRLSEVVGAMSYALDIVHGQPMGHAARSCAIGMRLAETIGLPDAQRSSLYYALLIKDAGCSTNASRTAELFGTDDREFKRAARLVDPNRPSENAALMLRQVAAGADPATRARKLASAIRRASAEADGLYLLRCERGADIARMVDLGEPAAQAIRALDEHWDGGGHPRGLVGEEIPVLGRILGLAQTVEVFHAIDGASFACAMARSRAGSWFDPDLVAALSSFEEDDAFWDELAMNVEPATLVALLEPADLPAAADEDRLDRIAEAFSTIIDAKSPFTSRHSEGVAELAVGIAGQLGLDPLAIRDLRRAALLHDIGKLGVSNLILDKPGPLLPAEWAQMRRHPELTLQILGRVGPFRHLASMAAAHHERLDGSGYHLGLDARALTPGARILAVADVCEALTADRPYRAALEPDRVFAIMREDVPSRLDPQVFAALCAHLEESSEAV